MKSRGDEPGEYRGKRVIAKTGASECLAGIE